MMRYKRKKSSRNRNSRLYTRGQLNYFVDDLIHPLVDKNVGFVVIDEILHMAVERNPEGSLKKFVRYNLPLIIRKVAEEL